MTAQTASKTAPTKVITGKVRASYVSVFHPRLNELSGNEEFSMALLIPKSDTDTIGKLRAAIGAAKENKWGSRVPPGVQDPIHDGDGSKPNGGEYGEECRGCWVLNVKSKQRPGIVDANVQTVIDPNEFVSGDYCRVSLNAYAYDNIRKGVSFGLNNIQVLAKGEPLGGSVSAEIEFGAAPSANDEPW